MIRAFQDLGLTPLSNGVPAPLVPVLAHTSARWAFVRTVLADTSTKVQYYHTTLRPDPTAQTWMPLLT